MALLLLTREVVANVLVAFKTDRWTVATALIPRSGCTAVLNGIFVQVLAVLLGSIPQMGCGHPPVNGLITPTYFRFVTITPQRKRGPGGWRAACVLAQIKHGNTGDVYICQFGVEMPIENEENGPISTGYAQEKAAECANNAAYTVLAKMREPTPPPLYTLCTDIRDAYRGLLRDAIKGSRVMPTCDPKTEPVVFGIVAPF